MSRGMISVIRYAVREATRECMKEKRIVSIYHYALFKASYHG